MKGEEQGEEAREKRGKGVRARGTSRRGVEKGEEERGEAKEGMREGWRGGGREAKEGCGKGSGNSRKTCPLFSPNCAIDGSRTDHVVIK